jgi:hypothetical protein
MDWKEISRFIEIFIGVTAVDNPADFMPPCPLPENQTELYDAMQDFWQLAPLGFLTAHNEAQEATPDPNA